MTAKKKPAIAAPAGMTLAELADEFGALKLALKPKQKREEALKEEFVRRGLTVFSGEKFVVMKTSSAFQGVDIKAAKAKLGAQWCADNATTVTRTSWHAAVAVAAAQLASAVSAAGVECAIRTHEIASAAVAAADRPRNADGDAMTAAKSIERGRA
jgi:hypothetical protein